MVNHHTHDRQLVSITCPTHGGVAGSAAVEIVVIRQGIDIATGEDIAHIERETGVGTANAAHRKGVGGVAHQAVEGGMGLVSDILHHAVAALAGEQIGVGTCGVPRKRNGVDAHIGDGCIFGTATGVEGCDRDFVDAGRHATDLIADESKSHIILHIGEALGHRVGGELEELVFIRRCTWGNQRNESRGVGERGHQACREMQGAVA